MNHRNLNLLSVGALAAPALAQPVLATVSVASGDAVRQWIDIKRSYEEMRGTRPAANNKFVPRTRVSDVKQIAARFSGELKKVSPKNALDRVEHQRWKACLDRIAELSQGKSSTDEYPENEVFWQDCTRRLAIYLESRKVVPSRWKLAVSALTETLSEVPSVLGGATRSAAEVAAGIVREPAKLAAVLLGAAVLLPPVIRALRR